MAISNREKHMAAQVEELRGTPFGSILTEMIEIGNPKGIYAKQTDKKRFEMLVSEMNRRFPAEAKDGEEKTTLG